jgi:predicted Zn-dependent protease
MARGFADIAWPLRRFGRKIAVRDRAADINRCGRLLFLAALCGAMLALGCALTVEQERQLGERFSLQVEREMRIVRDPVVVDYVRGMGRRLAAASGPQPFQFTFNVVDDADVNAFAGPGGYIYVHTGLLLKARNASELAAVMAHEISHVTLRHISRAVARQEQAAGLGALVQIATDSQTLGRVADVGASIMNLRYDRKAEADADYNGILLMRRAGYDPRGMITMFQLLQREGSAGGGGFLSSHPATDDRIENIRRIIASLPPERGLITNDGRLSAIQARLRGGTSRPLF